MKRASALLRKDRIYVQGYAETTAGIWIARGPVHSANRYDTESLGRNIVSAISDSAHGVVHPSANAWKLVQAPMLRATGTRSWAELAKGSKAVGIEYDGSFVKMVPISRYERDGGNALYDLIVERHLDASDLGTALIAAFERCA